MRNEALTGIEDVAYYGFDYCFSEQADYNLADKKQRLYEIKSIIFDESLYHQWISTSKGPTVVYLLVMVPGVSGNSFGEQYFQAKQIRVVWNDKYHSI